MLAAWYISYNYLLPESLRLDESQSMWQANRPFMALLEISARDVHMPLYNILLNGWIGVFGNNIFTNRILSLGFYLASIPMTFWLGSIVTGKNKVGLYLATLFTVSPFMNWFGSELRMYSMMVFFTICSHIIFIKIFQSKKQKSLLWSLYLLVSLLGIYSHYFFILFIICQCVFFVVNQANFAKSFKLNFLFLLITLGVGVSPWILYVRYINTAGSQTPQLAKPSTVDLFNVFSNHFFGFQVDSINSLILAAWPLFGILCLYFLQKKQIVQPASGINSFNDSITVPLPPQKQKQNSSNLFSSKYFYFGIMAFLPTVLLFAVSVLIRPVFLSRYLIMSLVPIYLILSSLLFSYKSVTNRLVKILIVILMCVALGVQIISPDTSAKENYRGTINYIISKAQKTELVAISAPFTIYPFYYYYNGSAKLVTIPPWDLSAGIPTFDEVLMNKQLDDFGKTYTRIYLVLSYDQGYEKKIKYAADSKFKLVEEKTFSPKLNLYVYDVVK